MAYKWAKAMGAFVVVAFFLFVAPLFLVRWDAGKPHLVGLPAGFIGIEGSVVVFVAVAAIVVYGISRASRR